MLILYFTVKKTPLVVIVVVVKEGQVIRGINQEKRAPWCHWQGDPGSSLSLFQRQSLLRGPHPAPASHILDPIFCVLVYAFLLTHPSPTKAPNSSVLLSGALLGRCPGCPRLWSCMVTLFWFLPAEWESFPSGWHFLLCKSRLINITAWTPPLTQSLLLDSPGRRHGFSTWQIWGK